MNQPSYRPAPRSDWAPVKTFDKDNVVVRVEKLDVLKQGVEKTFYRVKVGHLNHEKSFIPLLPMFTEGHGKGKITIKRVAEVVLELVKSAEDWIHNEAQYAEDTRTHSRIEREQKQADRDKPVTRVTGKTEKKRNKLKAKQDAARAGSS